MGKVENRARLKLRTFVHQKTESEKTTCKQQEM